ncbi:replication initiator 1-like [Pollicipes pollicipes]|uniref:replication initiator 1-like n=1 Tax=Pollicipes pollicipes TaxID=41117 RepID=UPI0018858A2A|nr:replication initiator 1-like [Pollicipes pollicipes]XP_037094789.1 replication initiator 1-like [Pollicipes pollicipes]
MVLTAAAIAGGGFACALCGRVYRRRNALAAHRRTHEGATTCDVCGAHISTVHNLRQHLRMVHRLPTEEAHWHQTHVCDACGRKYKSRDALVAHRKRHEGRTTCHLCGTTTSNVQNLRSHLELVHHLPRAEVRRVTGFRGGWR